MIRVLHVVHGMNRGGIETFIMNVYRSIDRKEIQFDFLTHVNKKCAYDDEILEMGGRIYHIPSRRDGVIKNFRGVRNFFREHHDFAAVHQHLSSLSNIRPLVCAKKYGIPIRIAHAHSTKEQGSFIHTVLNRFNRKRIDNIVTEKFACSDLASKWAFGVETMNDGRVVFIPNGIDSDKFRFDDRTRDRLREELNIADCIVLGHVGRFAEAKNHSFLVDVFNDFHKEHNDSVLMLIGNGILMKQIKEKVNSYDLENEVLFMENRSNVGELLQAMDFFLFPSIYEGFPVSLIEAQAAGLKCLVSNRITRQVKITDSVKYLSIDEGTKVWVNALNLNLKYERENKTEEIKEHGFGIKKVTEKIIKYYIAE